MHDEVSKESIRFAYNTTKVSARGLIRALRAYLRHRHNKKLEKSKESDEPKVGKQTVKELIGQGQGVQTVEIADEGIKDFQKVAKRYGVDFAVVKDKTIDPPRYTVFFKAKDADAITNVVRDYTAKRMKRKEKAERPSLLKKLAHFKDIVKKTPRKEHEKRKEQER